MSPADPIASAADIEPAQWPAACFKLSRSLHTVAVGRAALECFAGPQEGAARSVVLALWRQHLTVRYSEIAGDEQAALELARGGATWSDICTAFDDAPRAYQVLQGWLARSWIAALSVARPAL